MHRLTRCCLNTLLLQLAQLFVNILLLGIGAHLNKVPFSSRCYVQNGQAAQQGQCYYT